MQTSTRKMKKLKGWDFQDSHKETRNGLKKHRVIKRLSNRALRRSKDGYSADLISPKRAENYTDDI